MPAEPLLVEFEVATDPAHAFDLWAKRTALWWPKGHTMSGEPDIDIVFEGHQGGRIYERTGTGIEHDWGEVLIWQPPNRLRYLWHVFFDRSEATTVEVTFTATVTGETRVTIEQTGFESLGEAAQERRKRTAGAWEALITSYQQICAG